MTKCSYHNPIKLITIYQMKLTHTRIGQDWTQYLRILLAAYSIWFLVEILYS